MDDIEDLNAALGEWDISPIKPRDEEPLDEPRFIRSLRDQLAKQKRSSIYV